MTKSYYQKVITEVLTIVNNLEIDEYNRIPSKLIDFLEENLDYSYEFTIGETIAINDLPLKRETKGFLSYIYYNYICNTDEEKKAYLKILNDNEAAYQSMIKEKCNLDNFLNNAKKNESQNISNQIQIVEEKKSFFKKLLDKIVKLFRGR